MLPAKANVLLVEDEFAIVELVSFALREAGWTVTAAHNTSDAWEHLQLRTPDIVLLDWMLPGESGIRLLSKMRSEKRYASLPVIMLTAKSMEEDKVAGLNTGADDYITKPFSPRELTARVNALLRRKAPEHGLDPIKLGPLSLDPGKFIVTLNGELLDIGNAEFKLLKFLITHPERVFSRTQLLDKLWGDHAIIEERTVDVHILRLRRALKDAGTMVKTLRGVGYMLSDDMSA